jgi:hypothetical protein
MYLHCSQKSSPMFFRSIPHCQHLTGLLLYHFITEELRLGRNCEVRILGLW